jgi:hypothetical protein
MTNEEQYIRPSQVSSLLVNKKAKREQRQTNDNIIRQTTYVELLSTLISKSLSTMISICIGHRAVFPVGTCQQ